MDSPAVPVPLDPQEQPILDRLLRIRDKLLLLKQDKSSYIKSRDVLPLYDEVIAQVEALNAIRDEHDRLQPHNRCKLEERRFCLDKHRADQYNLGPVDYVLDDCFQLISLLFLTVGRNNEAPAT